MINCNLIKNLYNDYMINFMSVLHEKRFYSKKSVAFLENVAMPKSICENGNIVLLNKIDDGSSDIDKYCVYL